MHGVSVVTFAAFVLVLGAEVRLAEGAPALGHRGRVEALQTSSALAAGGDLDVEALRAHLELVEGSPSRWFFSRRRYTQQVLDNSSDPAVVEAEGGAEYEDGADADAVPTVGPDDPIFQNQTVRRDASVQKVTEAAAAAADAAAASGASPEEIAIAAAAAAVAANATLTGTTENVSVTVVSSQADSRKNSAWCPFGLTWLCNKNGKNANNVTETDVTIATNATAAGNSTTNGTLIRVKSIRGAMGNHVHHKGIQLLAQSAISRQSPMLDPLTRHIERLLGRR
mmetsp:Transcript_20554/g.57086  ORF Transcript_20554/g.57086 Transcript_20554/m.57086 type:complete len:282 (+) Transcript_20554:130-975(+)